MRERASGWDFPRGSHKSPHTAATPKQEHPPFHSSAVEADITAVQYMQIYCRPTVHDTASLASATRVACPKANTAALDTGNMTCCWQGRNG